MSATGRRLRQPGPERPERWLAAEGAAQEIGFELEPGLTLGAAIAGPLRRAGIGGATVELSGGAFGPFAYVMPALSTDPRYAAFYSARHAPQGRIAFERGVATFGRRDGGPFVHCHGVWREGRRRRGGHVMPMEAIVREPVRARAHATRDAAFVVLPDAETNFPLFAPVAEGRAGASGAGDASTAGRRAGGGRLLLLKVQPNEPLDGAILAACRAHGIRSARVHGIGSLVGARFADGRDVPSIATELFLDPSRVRLESDGAVVEIDVTLVDVDGAIHAGRLAADNPVCITCELCLVETLDAPRRAATDR